MQSHIYSSLSHTQHVEQMAFKRAEVDTSRPFRSVKEAVTVFGERIIASNALSHKGNLDAKHETTEKPIYAAVSSPPSFSSPSSHVVQDREDENMILVSLKKLEAELEETKRELRLLKERECETEVTVASLNAELHKSMSKLAEMEAAGAAQAAMSSQATEEKDKISSDRWEEETEIEERTKQLAQSLEYSPTLAQLLNLGRLEGNLGGRKKTKVLKKKKKPFISLIRHIFYSKKASIDQHDSLYTSPYYSVLG